MFDTSFLSPAQLEFVVITDTHYMLDPGDRPLEFESRRKQSSRAEVALKLVASLDVQFVLHLGDLSQEAPESERAREALEEARQQLQICGVSPHHVAGNHDIGDKPDPTMPTLAVTLDRLAKFHEDFGSSWYSFDHSDCHFVVLNSQILNTDLPDADTQWSWFEEDLSQNSSSRIFLFLHLPLYLWDEQEMDLGHYDNIGQPDRSRLLHLIRTYQIEHVGTGHVHFAFYDRIGSARFMTLQSPAFTRPGFSNLFTSAPPPEQGRDDVGKLGFYFYRVFPNRTDIHFLRTGGHLNLGETANTVKRLVTRLPSSLNHSPLGLTLRHPLTTTCDIPLAYPSTVRLKVRNDYPLLATLELGATSIRTLWTDLEDPFQARRLSYLRDEGVRITATIPDHPGLSTMLSRHKDKVDIWEIQLPGGPLPGKAVLQLLSENQSSNLEFSLSPIVTGEEKSGKQHLRTRIGYRLEELEQLDRHLESASLSIDRILLRVDTEESIWEIAHQVISATNFSRIGHIDLAFELPWTDDLSSANLTAEACFATALLSGSFLYLEPLIDLDRTMDINKGLLDTKCNPRPALDVYRCLNTVLFGEVIANGARQPSTQSESGVKARWINLNGFRMGLFISDENSFSILPKWIDIPRDQTLQLFCLREGTVEITTKESILKRRIPSPALLVSPSG